MSAVSAGARHIRNDYGAYAWGGMLGTVYIIDPENDLILLFYLNMFKRDALYPRFLSEVYRFIQ